MRISILKSSLQIALLFAALFVPGDIFAGGGVSYIANIDHHHGGPGPNYGFYYASCWGYVSLDGHEYALLGCYSGTSIIDLDANPIDEVAYVPGSNSEWKELKVWGDYAYAVSENTGQGLQIINLSQLPDTAWLVRAVYNVGGHNIANSHSITVADGYLYLNGGASNGTVILSLADPENPVYVGQYQPEYLHDTYVKRDTLYGAAIYGGGVYIADVSDKSNPVQIGHITYSGSGTHNTWKSDFGSYLFTTDEIGSTQKNMKVWDIADLPSYTQLAPFTADPSSIIHNVEGRGNYVYIAHYDDGVFVADIHDPMNIVNAGQYDTYLGGQTGYIGCWGVYSHYPSGRWIASDTQTGLYVLGFSGVAPRIRSPLLEPANGSTIDYNVTTAFSWRHAASQQEDPHSYQLHIFGPDVDTTVTTTDSTANIGPIFTGGETYSWSVLIQDEFTFVASQDTFQFSVVTPPPVSLITNVNAQHGGPGPNFGFYFASCWGYVARDGHEYALLGCYSGTSIIDLDANPIAEVAYIPGSNSEWKELKVWGDYAYAVSENTGQGLQIINLSQLPDTAWLVHAVYNVGGHNIANSHTVTVADGYLYLNGGASNGTVILSLADPENPAYVGQYQPEYLHDTYVKRDTLYGAAIYGGGVYIADVSDKSNPVQIGQITYSGAGTHNTWKSDFGSYLFTTDEIGSTQKNMKVWDISDLPSFTQLTPFTADPSSIIHNVHGRGNYVYIAHYDDGVFVADIHDPMNIVNAGAYDTYVGGQTGYVGCWGVYPYFPSGRWIASDTQTGLYVLNFSGLAPRIRSPLLAPANGSMVADNVNIDFQWRHAASQQEDPHHYQVHIFGPGVDTLLTTIDSTVNVGTIFTTGQTYSWSVLIQDEFTAVASQDTFQFSVGPSVGVKNPKDLPQVYDLYQNYPNPFNPTTRIQVALPEKGSVEIAVYNILGQEIATLFNGERPAGYFSVEWNGKNNLGKKVGSGIYLYRVTVVGEGGHTRFTSMKKMILLG